MQKRTIFAGLSEMAQRARSRATGLLPSGTAAARFFLFWEQQLLVKLRQDDICLLCGFKTRMRWSLFKQKAASCFAFMWAGFRLNSFIHSGFAFRPPCTQTRVARRHLSTSAARTAAAPQATQERRKSLYSENSTPIRAPRGALVFLVYLPWHGEEHASAVRWPTLQD